jgi:hypothetical protein
MPVVTLPKQGQLVQIQQRRYVVTDVRQCMLSPDPLNLHDPTPQHRVALSLVEDDALGEELKVIWEIEPSARVVKDSALLRPDGPHRPHRPRRSRQGWAGDHLPGRGGDHQPEDAALVVSSRILRPVCRLLEFERQLLEQISRSHEHLQQTRRALQLDPERVKAAVHIVLALALHMPSLNTAGHCA